MLVRRLWRSSLSSSVAVVGEQKKIQQTIIARKTKSSRMKIMVQVNIFGSSKTITLFSFFMDDMRALCVCKMF
jgi:hypothetical protein